MKKRYKILGTRKFGDSVRLIIEANDIVQEKQEFNPMDLMANPDGMQSQIQKMQNQALLAGMPDTITISYDEWQKRKYNTDDLIWIDLTPDTE